MVAKSTLAILVPTALSDVPISSVIANVRFGEVPPAVALLDAADAEVTSLNTSELGIRLVS